MRAWLRQKQQVEKTPLFQLSVRLYALCTVRATIGFLAAAQPCQSPSCQQPYRLKNMNALDHQRRLSGGHMSSWMEQGTYSSYSHSSTVSSPAKFPAASSSYSLVTSHCSERISSGTVPTSPASASKKPKLPGLFGDPCLVRPTGNVSHFLIGGGADELWFSPDDHLCQVIQNFLHVLFRQLSPSSNNAMCITLCHHSYD